MGRFKIENIVHPSSRKRAEDDFKCSLCLCILDEPAQTIDCHHVFCEPCLDASGVEACPCCRSAFPAAGKGWKPLKEVSRALLRQLHSLTVYCPNHREAKREDAAEESSQDGAGKSAPPSPKRRKVAGSESTSPKQPEEPETEEFHCDWEGDYGELLAKHIGECRFHLVDCPKGCGEKLMRKDLGAHADSCAKSFVKCEICGDPLRPGEMGQHRKEKAELHVQILEKKMEEKESDARLERMEATLARLEKAGAQREVIWEVKPADALRKAKEVGSFVESKTFQLLGAGPFHFRLCPRGGCAVNLTDVPGNINIFIYGPCKVKGTCKVVSGGTQLVGIWDWTAVFRDVSKGTGVPNASMPSVADFARYPSVTVSFEATEVVALPTTR
mmetsp:Transcript_79549/g.208911  ORF Transcript_79549/g.208911 Transcript_79549/m.208911 type:complete len:386 (-) Transcript_79549:20-1177(-)